MNKNRIINGAFVLSCLFAVALIKAHCCIDPVGHCPNWHVIYLNEPSQSIETDEGKELQFTKGSNGELLCPTCQHAIHEHGCDSQGLPVGPRFKMKE